MTLFKNDEIFKIKKKILNTKLTNLPYVFGIHEKLSRDHVVFLVKNAIAVQKGFHV